VSTINYDTLKIAVTISHKIKTSTSALLGNTINLEESVVSRILTLDSVSRPELASHGPKTEHQVQQCIPLLFAVAIKTCGNHWAT
jgi:hypothetical protein